jgi:hypothetical protein
MSSGEWRNGSVSHERRGSRFVGKEGFACWPASFKRNEVGKQKLMVKMYRCMNLYGPDPIDCGRCWLG